MSIVDFNKWIPEEQDSNVVMATLSQSAVEAVATRIPMNTNAKSVPTSSGVSIGSKAKGAAYTDDANTVDEVVLTARTAATRIRIAEEDLADTAGFVNILETKKAEWAGVYARYIDNAVLGTTAASNGGTVPFDSVYKKTATGNILKSAGAVTYDHLSNVLGVAEGSKYFDSTSTVVIAHPSFKAALRGIKDTGGMPVFVNGQGDNPDQLFGYQVRWSVGARTSATATDSPSGNPLMLVGPSKLLLLGVRSGPETLLDRDVDTDDVLLKARARRGFQLGADGFGILEVTSAG